jgi:hypothetical protein
MTVEDVQEEFMQLDHMFSSFAFFLHQPHTSPCPSQPDGKQSALK